MNVLDSIINFIKKGDHLKENTVPENACPTCWGHQEYGNQVRDIVEDHQVNVNGGREEFNFIKKFVVQHVEGIQLKNTINGKECPRCQKIAS